MLDFRPDLDPNTPGYLITLSEMQPSTKGYATAVGEQNHTAHTYTLSAGEVWPNVCFASRWQSQPGGIVIVGTNKKLNVYDYTNGFIDVSKGGGYAIGAAPFQRSEDAYGSFDVCAFGDVIVATNKSAPSQKRNALDLTAGTLFSDLGSFTAAPQGNTCCVAANFVFIGDVGNWSTVTGASDILAWSAIGDHTDWRVNPQVTQSSYAQFVDTPGAITAVRPFKDGIIVFKGTSMYRGRYVGAGPNSPIWDFERISDKIGCVGHRSVVNIDHALVFVGWRDIYIYDGTVPRSITTGIWEWIRGTAGLFDGTTPLQLGHHHGGKAVWFMGYIMTVTWSYKFDRWGVQSIQQTSQPIPCQTNGEFFTTWTVTGITAGVATVAESVNHTDLSTLRIVQGVPRNRNTTAVTPSNSFLITGWFGRPNKMQALSRVNPILTTRPATPPTVPPNMELTVYGSKTPGTGVTLGGAYLNSEFRFDTLGANPNTTMTGSTQNYFSFRIDSRERIEIIDIVPTFTPAGER